VREQLGARGVTLLCVSRLLPHKGIPQYIGALRRLTDAVPEGAFTALFAGEGPESETVERAARDFPRAIRNLGMVSPGEIHLLRILGVDSERRRIRLSMRAVTPEEQMDFMARRAEEALESTDDTIGLAELIGEEE
jgi:glycosyltransferase involved in cell wall biosynthesis